MSNIPFNRPYVLGKEFNYIREAIERGHLSGDGFFSSQCHAWLEERVGCCRALLTHSCTAALEMASILADIQAGDEVIMPSYTFVSTANAFVLRGGVPVFVDIREDTLNIDESKIEAAITTKTKALLVVHYAGVACEMNRILSLAEKYGLLVIEDAAHGILCTYNDRPLGGIGHFGAYSFHETKNVICGEGGALLINDPQWVDRAEIIRQKGTNRGQFFRGQTDKYTWVDLGSSYLLSEINAAFLWAQLEQADSITHRRLKIWKQYHEAFAELENQNKLRRPVVPLESWHNAHMYYLLLPNLECRTTLLKRLSTAGVNAVFHYIPLHSSPAGKRFGRAHGDLSQTKEVSDRLVRLPLWVGMTENEVMRVVEGVYEAVN